jgi:hypothetical protein
MTYKELKLITILELIEIYNGVLMKMYKYHITGIFFGECASPNLKPSVNCSALAAWQASTIYNTANTVV